MEKSNDTNKTNTKHKEMDHSQMDLEYYLSKLAKLAMLHSYPGYKT